MGSVNSSPLLAFGFPVETLCRELDIRLTEREFLALEREFSPYLDALQRHLTVAPDVPSHIPGAGSICVPITPVTDPETLFERAAGSVTFEQYEATEYRDYWLTVHFSTVPVVILLLKHPPAALPCFREFCARCSFTAGAPVGGETGSYFQWNQPGFAWTLHTDDEYEGVASRVHLPLITTTANVFAWARTLQCPRDQWLLETHLERGRVYHVRTDVPHTAINRHATDGRLHLILDVGSGA